MLINDKNYQLTPNMKKVSDCLNAIKLKHFATGPNSINLGINEGDYFVDIMIMENKKLNRISYYSKLQNLAFEEEMKGAVQDVISDINNTISYGHISLNSTELGRCYALYKCYSSPDNITESEIKFNLRACNYMVHQYFDDFAYMGINA